MAGAARVRTPCGWAGPGVALAWAEIGDGLAAPLPSRNVGRGDGALGEIPGWNVGRGDDALVGTVAIAGHIQAVSVEGAPRVMDGGVAVEALAVSYLAAEFDLGNGD